MNSGPPEPPGKIIRLIPGVSRGCGDRRVMLRDAVLQVVDHLVLRAVPPSQRLPLFDQARDLLDETGWGLDELYPTTAQSAAPDELLRALGLTEQHPELDTAGDEHDGSTTIPFDSSAAMTSTPFGHSLPLRSARRGRSPAPWAGATSRSSGGSGDTSQSRLVREVSVATDGNSSS